MKTLLPTEDWLACMLVSLLGECELSVRADSVFKGIVAAAVEASISVYC